MWRIGDCPAFLSRGFDAGYRAEGKGAHWVKKTPGWRVELVERPKKPAPEGVSMRWAKEWAEEGVAVDRQRLLPPSAWWCCLKEVGAGADAVVDRPTKEDEQRPKRSCVRAGKRWCTLP